MHFPLACGGVCGAYEVRAHEWDTCTGEGLVVRQQAPSVEVTHTEGQGLSNPRSEGWEAEGDRWWR